MNEVHLHGRLKEEFGGPFRLEIRDAKEAIRALGIQLDGFIDAIKDGYWRVMRGDAQLGEDSLDIGLGDQELHIIPSTHGAGGDGAGKVIVGAIMVAAAFYTGGASMAAWGGGATMAGAVGAGLVIAGASMMMAPTPETGDYEDKEKDTHSYLFNGPVNVNKQGVAIPLVYGEMVTGSVVVSAGIRAEDIPINSDAGSAFDGTVGKLEGK